MSLSTYVVSTTYSDQGSPGVAIRRRLGPLHWIAGAALFVVVPTIVWWLTRDSRPLAFGAAMAASLAIPMSAWAAVAYRRTIHVYEGDSESAKTLVRACRTAMEVPELLDKSALDDLADAWIDHLRCPDDETIVAGIEELARRVDEADGEDRRRRQEDGRRRATEKMAKRERQAAKRQARERELARRMKESSS